VDVADFDYSLPYDRVAQEPADERERARLLVDRGPGHPAEHRSVAELPELLGPGDLVVANNTRVVPARLALQKPSGGAVEVLLLERRPDGVWEALVRGSRRVAAGTMLAPAPSQSADDFAVEVIDRPGADRRLVRLHTEADEMTALDAHGEMPLPPYITAPLAEPERYQTVFADRPASSAAPTAGLHLTHELIDRCRARGAEVRFVDLAVGLDTFRPMQSDKVEDHVMHGELYRVPRDTWSACNTATRVFAIGTTAVRALESVAATGELEGRTELFIHGDYDFQVVDHLLTNFHLPRSSLLVLIEAFVGPRWREIYDEALAEHYRFLSLGDAMLLTRHDVWPPA
jgi:S-adenosylmethionine:tRNA ribosyltransferase-isomerase